MNIMSKILNHYLQFSPYTYPGLYEDSLIKNMPDTVREIGLLVRNSLIHRTTLRDGNTGSNADLKYGDMRKVPWWRQAEDDIYITAGAILNELYHRDHRGFTKERSVENKLVLTCRFTALLVASILKSKHIPARVRSGFASYFPGSPQSWDHWINQYWDADGRRWITIDVDGCLHDLPFDPFDMPDDAFDFAADAWLSVRSGKQDEHYFQNAGGTGGLKAIAWELFYDYHSLMNNEIIYFYTPEFIYGNNWDRVSKDEFKEIDSLAELLLDPDENFERLNYLWETKRKFRILKGALL